MPFRHIPPGQFSVDLLKRMQVAYDGACAKLKIEGLHDPQSSRLASIIIDLAAKGERENILQRALEKMSETKA